MRTSLLHQPTIRTATALDRDAAARSDAALLDRLAADAATRHLAILDGRALIRSNAARTAAQIHWQDAESLARIAPDRAGHTRIYLGRDRTDRTARFAHIFASEAEPPPAPKLEPPAALVDLRSLAMQGVMAADEMSLVGLALMLGNWHGNTRHCGRCGGVTAIADGGWKRICAACARDHFPRIDPVVIMLVTHGDRCVLSREARFPPGMVSTLAGFIEPGEDIAHAVARETQEEIGLEVSDVRFLAAQPWPFPHSLMIGCIAEAATFELNLDPVEIDAAAWHTADEVRTILARRPNETEPWLPGKQSLARLLVDTWLAEGRG